MRTTRSALILIITTTLVVAACGSTSPTPTASAPLTASPAASAAAQLPPLVDVPFYRGDPAGHGLEPGPGPTGQPQLAWRTKVGPMHMVPILVDGLVIVGTNSGQLVGLDAHTGEIRWDTAAGTAQIQPSLAAADGVVFGSDGTAIIAVDVATGTKRWSTPEDGATGRLNVIDGVVYDGFNGGVVGLDAATGAERWRWEGPRGLQVNAGPIADGIGYFATFDGRLYAVDTKTGKAVWPSAVQSIGTTVASGQVVGNTFFVSNNQGDAAEPVGEIYAIDRTSGKVRWRFRAPSGLQVKEGPDKDGILYANGIQDGIFALKDDGSSVAVKWQIQAPESHWPMALVGETLYQARTDGSVGAYGIADGHLEWQTPAEGSWANGPIVSGGMVFIATDTGDVLAYADPSLIAELPRPAQAVAPSPSTNAAPASNIFSVTKTFAWADMGISTPLGIDPGPDGNLYVFDVKPQVTVIDPNDGHVVRRWGSQGTGPGQFDVTRPDDNPGNGDIAVAPDGRVYVADGTNHRVQVFRPDGTFLFQFGSFGTGAGQFGSVQDIEVGPRGEVYARDDAALSKFSADGKFIWRSTETLGHFAVRGDGTIISVCELCRQLLFLSPDTGRIVDRQDEPKMDGDGFGPVNLDAAGRIYVQTYTAESILAFEPDGAFIAGAYLQPGMQRQVGGKTIEYGDWYSPTPVFLPDGRAFTFAGKGLVQLDFKLRPSYPPDPFTVVRAFSWADIGTEYPLGMDPGPDGLLYVFDTKPQVTVIDPKDGRVVRRWGRQGTEPGEFDVTRPDGNPGYGDIAVAHDGRVYVADGSNHRIQVFTPDGKFLFQFGSFGTKEGQFGSIDEVVAAPDSSIYVVEEGHWISKFRADGKFVWRVPTQNDPLSLAVRPDGVLLRPGLSGDEEIQLLDPSDGKVRGAIAVPQTGGGAGPINLDQSGNMYIVVFGGARPVEGRDNQDAELVYDRTGKFLGGRYVKAGMRHTGIARWPDPATYGDAFWPSPVFLPDGRGFTFGEAGLVELKVTLKH